MRNPSERLANCGAGANWQRRRASDAIGIPRPRQVGAFLWARPRSVDQGGGGWRRRRRRRRRRRLGHRIVALFLRLVQVPRHRRRLRADEEKVNRIVRAASTLRPWWLSRIPSNGFPMLFKKSISSRKLNWTGVQSRAAFVP